MNLPSFWSNKDFRSVRRLTRLLSLLPTAFFVSLIVFNDDLRSEPTLPVFIWGLVSVFLLAAWRWEKAGGRLTILCATLLLVTLAVGGTIRSDLPVGLGLLVSLAITIPYFIAGWLFYSLGSLDAHANHQR
jgi:hypothetical protein